MKKIIVPSLVLVLAAASLGFLQNNVKESLAASGLPTEIDLNDCTEESIRNYYASLNDKSEAERQGKNLLKNLKPILRENQVCYSYDSGDDVWKIYEIVDRDWTLSPASGIEGYNSSTNKISGYKYNSDNNPYLHALYVNRNAENQSKAWGDHTQKNYGINREHVWPKGLGFETEASENGARGDLMHLWAGNGKVNGSYHNNYYYGYVDKTKDYKDAKSDYEYLAGNLLGKSKTFGGDTLVFEPQDSDKGDIARIAFYMMARYNDIAGGDTINSVNPNLEIVNDITSYQKKGYESSNDKTGKMGILQDLLEWNKLDPVDSFEIHRNNLMFNNYSHNRNPFVDYPQWADYIWGQSSNGVYNNAPTGSANPQSDAIAKGNEAPVTPSEPTKTSLPLPVIIAIAAGAVVVLIILIIVFSKLSKKNKKKVLKTAKKTVKKSAKKSSKKK